MPRLTPKQAEHFAALHARMVEGNFGEPEVSSFLVTLRQHCDGTVKEVGNSIAHSERDSGRLFKRIRENLDALNALGTRVSEIRTTLFTAEDFAVDLNASLARCDEGHLPRETCDLIFLCGLSLIQGGTMRGKKHAEAFGRLSVAVSAAEIELHATIPITLPGKQPVPVVFPVTSVPNRWIPLCNPRAHVRPKSTITVDVKNFRPTILGLPEFNVHVERAPPIDAAELHALVNAMPRLRESVGGLEYTSGDGRAMPITFDGTRLSVSGLPEFFVAGSEFSDALKVIATTLRACVHDDANAHWFLEGTLFPTPPDGFHCHWIGRASATCTRPM